MFSVKAKENKDSQSGFTIIELLVVFSSIAILSTLSFAALSGYSNKQSLNTAVQDVKSILFLARSRAINQIKPSNYCTNKILNGYRVLICNGGNASCVPNVDYELDVQCNGTFYTLTTGKFSQTSGVNVANTSTSKSFFFIPLTSSVTGSGRIDMKAPGQSTQSITVQSTGVIQ